jgi:hypothetical protein
MHYAFALNVALYSVAFSFNRFHCLHLDAFLLLHLSAPVRFAATVRFTIDMTTRCECKHESQIKYTKIYISFIDSSVIVLDRRDSAIQHGRDRHRAVSSARSIWTASAR